MSRHERIKRERGATLVEMIVSITVLAVVASVALPVIHGATDAFAGAATARRTSERAAYALERVTRLLRDAPAGAATGEVGIRNATTESVTFTDGRGVGLDQRQLLQTDAAGEVGVLCEDVDQFEITYVGDDGVTGVISDPRISQRFHVVLVVGGFELRTCVFPRVRVVGE